MTDREAVHLLARVNRRYRLLTTSPIMTDEQARTWKQELENGLLALAGAGYPLAFINGPQAHYIFDEHPAEALPY